MLMDAVPMEKMLKNMRFSPARIQALRALTSFITNRFGGSFVYERRRIPFGRDDLADLFEIGEALRAGGFISKYFPAAALCDEPLRSHWITQCNTPRGQFAAGLSVHDDRKALTAALAEGLERTLWSASEAYFSAQRTAAPASMRARHAIDPSRFAGFSDAQRAENPELALDDSRPLLWIRARSFTRNTHTHVPAQVVSGSYGTRIFHTKTEPIIRIPITTGLATHETREQALLAGALEIIERDAFMITWLNRLTPPRADLVSLSRNAPGLRALLERCSRYRLHAEVVRLPTDAPTHVALALVRDESGWPTQTVGIKAHGDPVRAAEDAILEALRTRKNARIRRERHGDGESNSATEKQARIAYWSEEKHKDGLSFLVSGHNEEAEPAVWEGDDAPAHWARIVNWCREKEYELAAVELQKPGRSCPWYVEMVVMPEMQPMHQQEKYPYLGGERLANLPQRLGYASRSASPVDAPHPFI